MSVPLICMLCTPLAALKTDGEHVGKVVDVLGGFGTNDTLLVQLATNADDVINSRTR